MLKAMTYEQSVASPKPLCVGQEDRKVESKQRIMIFPRFSGNGSVVKSDTIHISCIQGRRQAIDYSAAFHQDPYRCTYLHVSNLDVEVTELI